jgi:hypothetical protein
MVPIRELAAAQVTLKGTPLPFLATPPFQWIPDEKLVSLLQTLKIFARVQENKDCQDKVNNRPKANKMRRILVLCFDLHTTDSFPPSRTRRSA